MTLPRIEDMAVAGKRLLVRADLNVPVEAGRVADATRIERFAAGMRPLLARGARLVILTHYGRPDPAAHEPGLSVERLCPALSKALGVPVRFAASCTGREAVALSAQLADGEAMLCENLRFDAGETANEPAFAAELAKLGDIYVNDAFSCAHRAHASIVAVASLLPAAAGPLLAEELQALDDALEAPRRPSVAIVGGAKVSTKIAVLKNLVAQARRRDRRRRHGEHLPSGRRRPGRPVAVRAGSCRHRAGDPQAGRGGGLPDRPARRHRNGARIEPRRRPRPPARSTPARRTR